MLDIVQLFLNLIFNIINAFLYLLPFGIFDNFSGIMNIYDSEALIIIVLIATFMGMIFMIFLLRFFSLELETDSNGNSTTFLGETIKFLLGGSNIFLYKDIVVKYFSNMGIKVLPIFLVLTLLYVPIYTGSQGYNTVGGVISDYNHTLKKLTLSVFNGDSSIAENIMAEKEQNNMLSNNEKSNKLFDIYDLNKTNDIKKIIKDYDNFSVEEKLEVLGIPYTEDINYEKYKEIINEDLVNGLKRSENDNIAITGALNSLKTYIPLVNIDEAITLVDYTKPTIDNLDSVTNKILTTEISGLEIDKIDEINSNSNSLTTIKNDLLTIYNKSKIKYFNDKTYTLKLDVNNLIDKAADDLSEQEKVEQINSLINLEKLLFLQSEGSYYIYKDVEKEFSLFNGAIVYNGPNISENMTLLWSILTVILSIGYAMFLLMISGRKNMVIIYIYLSGVIHEKIFDSKYGGNPLFTVKKTFEDNGIDLKELKQLEESGNEKSIYIMLLSENMIRLIIVAYFIYM